MEHRRYLQRPDEHSEPARVAAAFRHSGQADQRIFCIGGLIAHNKKRLLHFRLKRCAAASFVIRAGVPVPAHTVHPAIAVLAGISCRGSGWCACGRASKSVSAFADKSIRTCEKAVARQLSKTLYETRNFFQGQNGSKKVPGLDSSQFSCAGCYRIFSIPLFCPRPALFNPDSSCYNIH